MTDKPILVTGATGHIGNVLVRKLLERGEKVRALILPGEDTTALEGVPTENVEGDVLDSSSLWQAFSGVRGVFHLAGVISIMPGEIPIVRRVNVEGTINVLKAAAQAGVERLVQRPRRVMHIPGWVALSPLLELTTGWIQDIIGPVHLRRS
jgi:dihydroflavonol-4-reductase